MSNLICLKKSTVSSLGALLPLILNCTKFVTSPSICYFPLPVPTNSPFYFALLYADRAYLAEQ